MKCLAQCFLRRRSLRLISFGVKDSTVHRAPPPNATSNAISALRQMIRKVGIYRRYMTRPAFLNTRVRHGDYLLPDAVAVQYGQKPNSSAANSRSDVCVVDEILRQKLRDTNSGSEEKRQYRTHGASANCRPRCAIVA